MTWTLIHTEKELRAFYRAYDRYLREDQEPQLVDYPMLVAYPGDDAEIVHVTQTTAKRLRAETDSGLPDGTVVRVDTVGSLNGRQGGPLQIGTGKYEVVNISLSDAADSAPLDDLPLGDAENQADVAFITAHRLSRTSMRRR